MTDNTTLNPGASGDTVRDLARQGGAVKTQVVQLDLGGASANAEVLITAGHQTMANSVPVAIASDQSTLPVSLASLPALAAGTAAIGTVSSTGSTGLDYSANRPALPNIAASPFGGTTIYSAYVLVATLAANPSRNSWGFQNCSGARCVLVLDDGTASSGSAPANATCYAIEGGAAPGFQGGGDGDREFKGRVQVYAAVALTGSAYVALYQR